MRKYKYNVYYWYKGSEEHRDHAVALLAIIWKLNKEFIDEQISSGKNILLSNNPNIGYYFPNGNTKFYHQ